MDELGLDRLDRAVLDALCRRFGGGPVGLSTLAVAVGEEAETVETVAEPFLVREGLLARTPRGRVATAGRLAAPGPAPPLAPSGRCSPACWTTAPGAGTRPVSGRVAGSPTLRQTTWPFVPGLASAYTPRGPGNRRRWVAVCIPGAPMPKRTATGAERDMFR